MDIQNRARWSPSEIAALAAELADVESLSDVLKWGRKQTGLHPAVIADVVVQDEFTHDAIVPWSGGRSLVFGST
jgi:hypothetical protein